MPKLVLGVLSIVVLILYIAVISASRLNVGGSALDPSWITEKASMSKLDIRVHFVSVAIWGPAVLLIFRRNGRYATLCNVLV